MITLPEMDLGIVLASVRFIVLKQEEAASTGKSGNGEITHKCSANARSNPCVRRNMGMQ